MVQRLIWKAKQSFLKGRVRPVEEIKRIFIVGSQRSGTTLMRLILGSHPKIHALDEEYSYRFVQEKEYKLPKGTEYVALKTPIWTDYLVDSEDFRKRHRDDDLIIFMFRDVRAVVASMKTLHTDKGVFIDEVLTNMDEGWIVDGNRRFKDTYLEEYQKARKAEHSDVRRAAIFWKYKTSKYFAMKGLGWKILPVRYESLVESPRKRLEIVCEFIGVTWDNKLLKHNKLFHDEVNSKGFAVGNTSARRAIDTDSIDKWMQVLTPAEQEAVLATAGDLNRRIMASFE